MARRPPIANAAIADMMSLMAHDLRNPLAIALTNLNYVRGVLGAEPGDVDDALGDAALACSALERLVANLDVIGVAVASAEPAPSVVALRTLVAAAVSRILPHALAANVGVVLDAEGESPLVRAHDELLGRAVDNLLANAVQYSRAGGQVRLRIEVDGRTASVVLSDAGPVVPLEDRDEVFAAEAQARAKQRLETRYGRGLGLFCAAQAAAAAGGSVAAGQGDFGATFTLRAPLAQPAG